MLRSELCCGIEESTWWVLHRTIRVLHFHLLLDTFLCLYVLALNLLPLHLKPQMGHLKMVSRFSSSLACNRKAAWEAACSYSPCPSLLVRDINNDEFLIRTNKQLSKNVTKDTARARFLMGFFENLSVPFSAPRFIVVKIPFPPAGAFVPR
ncbi:uncharacterized [Tachysurus ichikawai]